MPIDVRDVVPLPSAATSNRDQLFAFIGLRGTKLHQRELHQPSLPDLRTSSPAVDEAELQDNRIIPEHLLAHASFKIDVDERSVPPSKTHKYISSLALIQKRGIVQQLTSPEVAAVELIERPSLEDVDLIVDAGAAVVYFVLAALPSGVNQLSEKLSKLSSCYSKILVIFEAYPPKKSRTAQIGLDEVWGLPFEQDSSKETTSITPYVFSPPVMKAFKQLRRLLVISETTQAKKASCKIEFAFAIDEVQAAAFARMFGDSREAECAGDPNVALSGCWDDRSWLVEGVYQVSEISL